jgi:hypothetical protein
MDACEKVKLCSMISSAIGSFHFGQFIFAALATTHDKPATATRDVACLFCKFVSKSIIAVDSIDKKDLPALREIVATVCTFLPPVAKVEFLNNLNITIIFEE